MKNKIHRDLPWKPAYWVGDKLPVQLSDTEDDFKKDSVITTTAAILRAMRK